MKLMLNENIRSFRKQRGITQEQLAESMGVSIGAVSKWESGLSNPELSTIAELADFFEVSVDVLLGYELKSHNIELAIKKIKQYNLEKRFEEARSEALKALQKYPNNFDIVYLSGVMFSNLSIEKDDEDAAKKAEELFTRALSLIDQNTDADINFASIQNRIAILYAKRDDFNKAIEILKKNNTSGVNNAKIGNYLARTGKYEEAMKVLSESYIDCIVNLYSSVIGMSTAYGNLGKFNEAIELTEWMIDVLKSLEVDGKASYVRKMIVCLYVINALIYYDYGKKDLALGNLKYAAVKAAEFDNNPSFSCSSMRFYCGKEHSFYDDAGETATDAIERMLKMNDNEKNRDAMINMWNEYLGGKAIENK